MGNGWSLVSWEPHHSTNGRLFGAGVWQPPGSRLNIPSNILDPPVRHLGASVAHCCGLPGGGHRIGLQTRQSRNASELLQPFPRAFIQGASGHFGLGFPGCWIYGRDAIADQSDQSTRQSSAVDGATAKTAGTSDHGARDRPVAARRRIATTSPAASLNAGVLAVLRPPILPS